MIWGDAPGWLQGGEWIDGLGARGRQGAQLGEGSSPKAVETMMAF